MTTPDYLHLAIPYPVPGPDHAALLASYHLLLPQVADSLPVNVRPSTGTPFFESWELTRAAFMARMASTLRHLGYLAPSYSQLDGLALARTLVDHAITFAWISGSPSDRLPAFIRDSYSRALGKHKALEKRGERLLDEGTREGFEAYLGPKRQYLQGLSELSEEADASWRDKVVASLPESLQIASFHELYLKIYNQYSGYDHASTLGLGVFVHLTGSPVTATVDGEPERDLDTDLRPYWIAMFAFAEALIVAHMASGRPRLKPLQEALENIGTLRQLDRSGRLVVTQTPEGTTIGIEDEQPDDGG